jgi:hypothetical protein
VSWQQPLSLTPVLGRFIGAQRLPNTDTVAYEDGPIALQDPSQGNLYQVWRMRYVNDTVYMACATVTEFPLFTLRGITALSFTFDQNARYLMTYCVDNTVYLWWFDPILNRYDQALLVVGGAYPRITLDDKRKSQEGVSQVVLAYIRAGNLCCRVQQDRYGIEYVIQTQVKGRLIKMGMTNQYRLQFLFEANTEDEYSATFPWGDV